MEPDKRRFVRKRADQLLYAEFGPDNGSILLNLCEEGCSFQSMAPVREEQLRFSVSVGDGRKLEGDGVMVWSDVSKKTGGLRFLNPSRELQEQVRGWLEGQLVRADGKIDPSAMDSPAKRRRKKLREEARAEAERGWREGPLKAGDKKPATEVETGVAKAAATESAVSELIPPTRATEHFVLGPASDASSTATWRGVGAIALSAMLLMTLIGYRRELGHLMMSLGSSIAGEEPKGGVAVAPDVRPVTSNVTSEDATSNVDSDMSSPAKPAAISNEGDSIKESGAEAVPVSNEESTQPVAVSSGAAKQGAAQQAGGGDVPSLWTSVENGDTRAEVALAGRYVRGDGVPQSCAQARVLLEAAAKRGSAEAKHKLDDLGQAGCQ
jgi:hypothetical protein